MSIPVEHISLARYFGNTSDFALDEIEKFRAEAARNERERVLEAMCKVLLMHPGDTARTAIYYEIKKLRSEP